MSASTLLTALLIVRFGGGVVVTQCPTGQTGSNSVPIVVKMCELNSGNAQTVSIDTSGAAATVNIPGVMCTCTAVVRNAKAIRISSTGRSGTCGSRVRSNTTSGEIFNTGQDCSGNDGHPTPVVYPEDLMGIHFIKEAVPYAADFCITYSIVHCEENQFQCNDGSCISTNAVCDAFPDCHFGEEERVCGISCSEGQIACSDGSWCVLKYQVCDGNQDCGDNSDETERCVDSQSATPTKAVPKEPSIEITCFPSQHLSTTTTTTTTTPTTTTPPTTTTQTTTPTTTSTTSRSETTIGKLTTVNTSVTPIPSPANPTITTEKSTPTPTIVGAVVGSMLGLVIIIAGIAWCLKHNQNSGLPT